MIWLGGDLYKLSYYMANLSPLALRACASFQIFMDLCILAQFALYRKNTKGNTYDELPASMDAPKVDTNSTCASESQ